MDWSKLLNKPPLFDYKTIEDEIRAFRDWSWQLVQFLNTIDPGFEKELQALMDDPGNARTIVEEMPTSSDMCSILIDSGSKSSVGLSGIYWCSFRFVVRLAKRFF